MWYGQGLGWRHQVDVLLVQDSVRKLLLEAVLIQELLDPPRDDRLLQDLIDIRSSMNVHSKHLRDEGFKFPTEMRREGRIFSANNF